MNNASTTLSDFAFDDFDSKVLDCFENSNRYEAAAKFSISVDAVRKRVERARKRQRSSEADESQKGRVTRESVLEKDSDGQILKWTRIDYDKKSVSEKHIEALKAGALDEIKPISASAQDVGTTENKDDLTTFYAISDLHIGMLSYSPETGQDFDTDIAEQIAQKFIDRATKFGRGKYGVLAQLGDMLHYDSLESITPTSSHVLDSDTRYHRIVRVAIRVMRRMISKMLDVHDYVYVFNIEGNHDMSSAAAMSEFLAALYENEDRVIIDTSPSVYRVYTHKNVSIFMHHGHKKKINEIDRTLAAEFPREFGNTEHRYAHIGHFHHWREEETLLMNVMQHRTLAPRDSHAARSGLSAASDAKVIVYDSDCGEVERHSIAAKSLRVK